VGKPTIFFSHSSKDKDMILLIKDKLDEIAGGAINIFQSSDGQSIKFGHNWLRSVENGLDEATIMFIFVTPNAIASNWIYFEAGVGYAKNIQVVPIGLGVDISLLKGALNILQGFNVTSGDSLNNLVSIINDKYDFRFSGSFSEDDYVTLMSYQGDAPKIFDLSDVFSSISFSLRYDTNDGHKDSFADKLTDFWVRIKKYINAKSLDFSNSDKSGVETFLVKGVRIGYYPYRYKNPASSYMHDRMDFTISPYRFEQSFSIFIELIQLLGEETTIELRFNLRQKYLCLTSVTDMAAILLEHPDEYALLSDDIGTFVFKTKEIQFSSSAKDRYNLYYLYVSFASGAVSHNDIYMLATSLLDKRIIREINVK